MNMTTKILPCKHILEGLKRHSIALAANQGLKPTATRCASSIRQYHLLTHQPSVGTTNNICLKYSLSPDSLQFRAFSDKTSAEEGNAKDNDESTADEESKSTEENASTEPSEVEKLEEQLKEMKDQLLRSLAEQENIRRIAKKDVENARSFAVTSFAKSLLDTSDNLSRALDAVPAEFRDDKENHAVLATLYEGIKMTDDGLNKAFAKNGLKKFGEAKDKFDPNMHEALFEYPDANMEAGTIGQVMKGGFTLNGRVIRPAEVGVIKSA
mmetsp:Transcript_16819/g.20547  ORF Transcript_16819/g.20547 Transcript_16819/m.20547 type:complete len:268 (-) Transcript_16819:69-872(-)